MFEHATNIRFLLSLSPEEKLLGRWTAIYPGLYTGLLLNSENIRKQENFCCFQEVFREISAMNWVNAILEHL